MNVEIRNRNGWLYAVVRKQRGLGRAIVRRLGTKSMEEAKELVRLADLEKQALAAKADAIGLDVWTRLLAGRKVRVRDAVAKYEAHRYMVGHSQLTISNQAAVIDLFLRETGLANSPIAAIETNHVATFVNPTSNILLGSRTLRLKVLNVFLDYCFREHLIVRNPALDVVVRVDKLTQAQLIGRPILPFTEEEVKRLLQVVPRADYWHGAILIGHEFGLRLSAVSTLEHGNVVANRLRLFTKKGRRIVDEPMSPELAQWLLEWRDHRPVSDTDYVFPAQAAMRPDGLSVQFGRLLKKHGVKDRSFHSLRKTATARVWNEALQDLGGKQAAMLAAMVARNGYRRVQEMLAHAPGSNVTADCYLPKSG